MKRSLSFGDPGQAHGKLPTWRRPRKAAVLSALELPIEAGTIGGCNCRVEKVAEVEEKGP